MEKNVKKPVTLTEAITYFSDADRAFEYAVELRWPDGDVTCPRCGNDKHSFIKTRRLWFCKGCKKQFTVKVGTIFEDSPLGLDKWMTAVWMLVNCKNGISSHELGRALGITQKSAWFMLQRIRLSLRSGFITKMGGPGSAVEADESFIGGRAKNMHAKKRMALRKERNECLHGDTRMIGKAVVMGLLDREQRQIRATVIPAINREVLQNEILKHVAHGSKIYTDEARPYRGLPEHYTHDFVNHMEKYVDGQVHTNGLENFWSLLKRGLRGTYVAVEPFHLSRYIDEQVFRYNNRKDKNDAQRFALAMNQVAGKRLTYAELTGKDESPRDSETGTRETEIPF